MTTTGYTLTYSLNCPINRDHLKVESPQGYRHRNGRGREGRKERRMGLTTTRIHFNLTLQLSDQRDHLVGRIEWIGY